MCSSESHSWVGSLSLSLSGGGGAHGRLGEERHPSVPAPHALGSCFRLSSMAAAVSLGERRASFQLPVSGSKSCDKKMCLFIPKYLDNPQFHVCVQGGAGTGSIQLEGHTDITLVVKVNLRTQVVRRAGDTLRKLQRSGPFPFHSLCLARLLAEPWNNINLSNACTP